MSDPDKSLQSYRPRAGRRAEFCGQVISSNFTSLEKSYLLVVTIHARSPGQAPPLKKSKILKFTTRQSLAAQILQLQSRVNAQLLVSDQVGSELPTQLRPSVTRSDCLGLAGLKVFPF